MAAPTNQITLVLCSIDSAPGSEGHKLVLTAPGYWRDSTDVALQIDGTEGGDFVWLSTTDVDHLIESLVRMRALQTDRGGQ